MFRPKLTRRASRAIGLLPAVVLLASATRPGPALEAQEGLPPLRGPSSEFAHYQWLRWSYADGFPAGSVRSVLQGADGILWILTPTSVVRYDGFDFTSVPLDSTRVDAPRRLNLDREGRLHVVGSSGMWGIRNGRGQYTGRDDLLASVTPSPPTPSEGPGRIVILGAKGISARDLPPGVTHADVTLTFEDEGGRLWVGTERQGLFRYDSARAAAPALDERFLGRRIQALHLGRDGTLWVGTDQGLYAIPGDASPGTFRARRFGTAQGLSSDDVQAVLEDHNGELWIGTRLGLDKLSAVGTAGPRITRVLSNVVVTALTEDREQDLWVGTRDLGLWCRRPALVTPTAIGEAGDDAPRADKIFQDRDGTIWVSTRFGELFRWSGDGLERVTLGENPFDGEMFLMAEDTDGRLLFGTENRGVWVLADGRLEPYRTPQGPIEGTIVSLYGDSAGRLWVGRLTEDLGYYQGGRYVTFLDQKSYPGKQVFTFLEDRRGNLWLGGAHGVTLLPEGDADPERSVRIRPEAHVLNLLEDEGGTVWAGTAKLGLLRIDPETRQATAIRGADGLGCDEILSLLEDDHGYAWMACERGVLRIRRDDLAAFAPGGGERLSVSAFRTSDGLREVGLGGIKTRSGKLLYATRDGLAVVDPASVPLDPSAPGVLISLATVDGRPSAERQAGSSVLEMTSHALLEVRARAVTFRGTEALTYRYRLEGRDAGWTWAATDGELAVDYPDLEPGEYTFRVAAANNHGVWSEDEASLAISVKPTLLSSRGVRYGLLLLLAAAAWGVGGWLKRRRNVLRNKYRKTRIPEDTAERYEAAVTRALAEERVYRDSSLSLEALGRRLDIAPHHLSQVINQRLGKNFFHLVNGYRIEEAKKLLQEDGEPRRRIIDVAFDVGFNTLNSFNRAFKRHVGMTPSEFREQRPRS